MEGLNIESKSPDWRARRLSNFSADPFSLDNTSLASVEGFIQGIKFPENDERRKKAFSSSGKEAKKIGEGVQGEFVWWQGEAISFRSREHFGLIEKAIRAKFDQNPEAESALLATKGLDLIHELEEPESPTTSLPKEVFIEILTRIREEKLHPEGI
jgi:predicted NAD-dependent protein-ADP-ribosyltransferase YbiA (DUF1768 family)